MNCHNSARFLGEAIESVFQQTHTEWEIIFWDNRSTDASAEIARRYEGKLRYFRGEEFLQLGAARNEAIGRARGEFVALLDCDDVWLPEKLERQVPLLEADPALGMVFSDSFFIDEDGEVLGTAFGRVAPPAGDPFRALLSGRNFIPCLTVLIPRRALEKVGGFNPTLRYVEDYDLFLRISRSHGIAHVNEPVAKYRLHGTNLTGTGSRETTREMMSVIRDTVRATTGLSIADRWAIRKRLIGLQCKLLAQY